MALQKKFVRVNQQIRCPQVRVKRGGDHLGVMPTYRALEMAQQESMDLVEVGPDSIPPVCEIMDYGRFRFEEKRRKKEQSANSKSAPQKEVRLRPVSGDHDVDVRVAQIRKFLEDGHPVSLVIVFKSREIHYKDRGFEIVRRVTEAAAVSAHCSPPRFDGNRLSVRLVPKAKNG